MDGQNHEVEFRSLSPYNADDFSDGYIINAVNSSLYGQGRTHIVVSGLSGNSLRGQATVDH